MTRMHIDELPIDDTLVRRLVDEQFPEWVNLPLLRIEPTGTVNAIFRLGAELSVRLARRNGPTEPGGTEYEWLPTLAPLLPVEIPVPVAQGHPADDYPWFWEIHTWVDGETQPVEHIDPIQAARDLAKVISALQHVSPAGAPPGRGIPLAERDEVIRDRLSSFDRHPSVAAEWERALAAPPWAGPPVWHHGDLDARNWLIRDWRISGVIDWGSMGVGDPACDVMVAWKLHSPAARDAFREALPTDDATWERARGWALSQAVMALTYYTPANNPSLYREAESWLDLVLSEREYCCGGVVVDRVVRSDYALSWPRRSTDECDDVRGAVRLPPLGGAGALQHRRGRLRQAPARETRDDLGELRRIEARAHVG